jgi:hypothetical protein
MSTATDVLRTKTDAELQFFVDNPGYYHADLVAAAQQELQRRGLAPVLRSSQAMVADDYDEEPSAGRRPLFIAAMVLGLAGAGGALVWASRPAAQPLAASRPVRRAADSLKLESVTMRVIPNFDIDGITEGQVAQIPASEKQEAQALRQFRGLCRRFWAAETQSEFLTAQAYAGQAGPTFAEQTMVARETWRNWNKAAMYGYRFGPKMQAQYEHMAKTASSQQHILDRLPSQLADGKYLTDKELVARTAETQDWLASLRKVSPVTGRPYRVTVMKMQM